MSRAKHLRSTMTDAERLLWRHVRSRGLDGYKIRRQHPLEPYIVDFVCLEQRVVIEIDGGQHARAATADAERTKALEARGFRVLRFWNHEVLANVDGVLAVLLEELKRG